jgi:hypothetical protein
VNRIAVVHLSMQSLYRLSYLNATMSGLGSVEDCGELSLYTCASRLRKAKKTQVRVVDSDTGYLNKLYPN